MSNGGADDVEKRVAGLSVGGNGGGETGACVGLYNSAYFLLCAGPIDHSIDRSIDPSVHP